MDGGGDRSDSASAAADVRCTEFCAPGLWSGTAHVLCEPHSPCSDAEPHAEERDLCLEEITPGGLPRLETWTIPAVFAEQSRGCRF